MSGPLAERDPCPGCGHLLASVVHSPSHGCLYGWDWGNDGIVTTEGCRCNLALAWLS